MKKTILLLVCLSALFGGPLAAQTKYTTSIFTDNYLTLNVGFSPVANWRSNYTVTFIQNGTTYVPCLIDHSQYFNTISPPVTPPTYNFLHAPVSLPPMPTGVTINDLYVVDDFVFFCGSQINSVSPLVSEAIWGYFDINDFFSTSVTFYYGVLSPWTSAPPVSLERLVAYPSGSDYKVVSYGKDAGGQYKIVEIDNVRAISGTYNIINVANMIASPNPPYVGSVMIDDITLTEDYVVFTGHDLNIISPTGVEYPWYIYGKKVDVVNEVCTWGHCNYIPVPWESNAAVSGVAMDSNHFAMAYTHFDSVSHSFYTRLRVIDPDLALNTHSQEFVKVEKEDPRRLVYLADLEVIELLENVRHPSDFVRMYPYATSPYPATVFYSTDYKFMDMCNITGHHFIASSKNVFYLQDCSASLPHSNPVCPEDGKVKVVIIGEKQPEVAPGGASGLLSTNKTSITSTMPSPLSIHPDCFSFE